MIDLPDAALAKLTALEAAANDARALLVTCTERRGKADERLLVLRQRRTTIDPEGPRHAELTAEIARAETELAHLSEQQRERAEKHGNHAQVLAEVRAWLTALPSGTVLEVASVSAPTLRRGDTIASAIERVRATIETAQRELQMIQFAPPTSGEIETQVRAYVERLRRSGAPLIGATHERGLAVNWFGVTPGTPAPQLGPTQVAAMLCWANPTNFTERLLATFADQPNAGEGISASDKKRRIAALTAQLEELERREELLIEAAASNDQEILRRPHASPLAILGIGIRAGSGVAAAA